jgi:heme exporter protein C
MLNRLFLPLAGVAAAMFAYAPFMILAAPYESTMGLVQKIFYFHVPAAMTLFLAACASGIGSAVFLSTR